MMKRLQLRAIDPSGATGGQSPVWDATANRWVPGDVTGGGGSVGALDDLTDVAITSATATHVLRFNGTTWVNVGLVKADVGLGNVDNTSDAAKPISTATQTALNGKAATSHTHAYAPVSHTHSTADIVSGVFAAARLGTGTADATTFLRGDGTWAVPSSGGGGTASIEQGTALPDPATKPNILFILKGA